MWFNKRKSDDDQNKSEKEKKRKELLIFEKKPKLRRIKPERSYSSLANEYTELISNPTELTLRKVDPVTLVLFVIIAAFAFIVSLSATNSYADTFYDNKFHFVIQNIIFFSIGIVLIVCAIYAAKSLHLYTVMIGVAYLVTVILLVLVLFIGTSAGGAKRWIEIAGISIQPSELAKTTLVLVLALFMSLNHSVITDKRRFFKPLLYGIIIPFAFIGFFCILVYFEKHNSGMIILAAIGIATMFIGGARGKWLIAIGIFGVLCLAVLVLLTGHGVDRITGWWELLTGSDVAINDDNWQTMQGLYAISSGGLFGLGPGQSRLKYGYVSQPQNDFIYPIICEELGFVGGVAVLLLFFAIFIREMKLATHANNLFVSITIGGLAVKLMIQVLLNILVVTALIPNTGISLPLFSAGGSAMVIQMLEFGIVLGLSRYCEVK